MTKEEKIKHIQQAADECWYLRKKLILDGLALDNEAILHLDERLWVLILRLYILTEKNGSSKARILSEFGIHLN